MPLTVAVQMDPIASIRIAGNSTFALLLEAQARGHRLLHYTPDRLRLSGTRVEAMAEPLEVKDVDGDHARLGEPLLVDLSTVDVVLLRQDPPFDLAYITTTHLLERIHPRTLVVNDPRSVRDAPEKLFVMDFPELMPPTLVARDRDAIEAFRAEHGEVVMKPLYGFGGAAVFKVGAKDPNFGSLFDLFTVTLREPWVIQKFLPAVSRGDKRIILVDGEAMGAVNRVPTGDDIRSNMVRGGAARGDGADAARAGDLREDRPGAQAARAPVRRHRRDRRLSDGDQHHLADRDPRHQAPRRAGSRRGDLGRDRGEAPGRGEPNLAPPDPLPAPGGGRIYRVDVHRHRSRRRTSPDLKQGGRPRRPSRPAFDASQNAFGGSRRVPPRGDGDPSGGARGRARRGAQGAGGRRNGSGVRRDAERPDRRSAPRRARNDSPLARPAAAERGAPHDRGGRRIWAGHAGAGLRHRSPVPPAAQADARSREDRRGPALRAVGPQAESRPCNANSRRMPEAGARRPDDPDDPDRGAARHGGQETLSRLCKRASTGRSWPRPRRNSSRPSSPNASSA